MVEARKVWDDLSGGLKERGVWAATRWLGETRLRSLNGPRLDEPDGSRLDEPDKPRLDKWPGGPRLGVRGGSGPKGSRVAEIRASIRGFSTRGGDPSSILD
jgi:hypothetical protein